MADDVVTQLIASGGAAYVRTLTAGADAQDRLTESIKRAASLPPAVLGATIADAASKIAQADKQAEIFRQTLTNLGGLPNEAVNKVTQSIERQTKALRENAELAARQARPSQIPQQFERIAEQRFLGSAPSAITRGPDRVNIDGVTDAVTRQGTAFNTTRTSGISYLSQLSAIHAASFLLFGTTFSTIQSIGTLGLAFGNAARGAQSFNVGVGLIGVGIGGLLLGIHTVAGGIENLIRLAQGAAEALVKLGQIGAVALAGAVAGATQLASRFEDVAAEIIAFGEPSRQQFNQLENLISGLARRFGQSASGIAEGASVFIRAGGDIARAMAGGVEAVTLLQIASRGELIPSTAARGIVTITNAFSQFKDNALGAADIFVGTAQKSALSFQEVLQAFQQAGPTAALLKIPLLDLATTIAVLSNEGLRGTVAGTGFKQFLLDLLNPSQKASQALEGLGVSIQDQNKKIRPLRDIFIDLKKALGETATEEDVLADASKAQALAVIFGSRANLAAAIIARTGAAAFDEMKVSIAGVSAIGVVEILRSTTSAQVERLKTNIEELARAFGGPLNVGIGSALRSLNEFITGIDRSGFQQAGQALIAVITGQGFGPIKQALDSIQDTRVSSFLENLLNSLLTIRNAVVSQLIPALTQAGQTILNAFGNSEGASRGINGVTGAIVALISSGSRLVTFLGDLAADFIDSGTRTEGFRDALGRVANTITTTLSVAFRLIVLQIGIAIAAVDLFGKAILSLGDLVTQVQNHFSGADEKIKSLADNALKASDATRFMQDRVAALDIRINGLREAKEALEAGGALELGGVNQGDLTAYDSLKKEIADLETQRDAFIVQEGALRVQAGQTEQALKDEQATLAGTFATIRDRFANTFNTDQITNFLSGELPNEIAAAAAKLTEIEDRIRNSARPDNEPSTEGAIFPDPKKQQEIERQVVDIVRRANEERLNVETDAQEKNKELTEATLDKLITLHTNYNRAVIKLNEDTDKRLQRSDEDFKQSRADRDAIQIVQRNLEAVAFFREQDQAKRDLLLQQADAAEDRSNQRRVQDTDRTLSQLENREQRSEDIKESIRDRAFQRQQQDEERTFSLRQSKESTAFERNLQDQATARDNARRLAEAKTPEERLTVTKNIKETREDTVFARSQEDKLTKFREQQDQARVEFQRKQENESFQRQIDNEQKLFEFRLALELKYLGIRRELENTETLRTDQVAFQRLLRSLGFARDDHAFRLQQQDQLQSEQDKLSDQQHERERQRTEEDRQSQLQELRQRLQEDTFNLFDDASRTQNKNLASQLAQTRNITQRATRDLVQLTEREPTAQNLANRAILELNLNLADTIFELQLAANRAENFFGILRDQTLTGLGLSLEAPRRSVTLGPQFIPAQVNQQINEASRNAALSLAPVLQQIIPAAVVGGLAQLAGAGIGQRNLNVTVNGNTSTEDLYNMLRNLWNAAR